jgi:hypothetical protein
MMKRQWFLGPLLMAFSVFGRAQSAGPDPVHWTFGVVRSAGNDVEIRLAAHMERGWHIYAQVQPKEAISQPTKISFRGNPLVQLQGPVNEQGNKETYTDKTAGILQYQYADSVVFTQPAVLKGKAKTRITGTISYQTCTVEMCLPPKTISFSIPIQ